MGYIRSEIKASPAPTRSICRYWPVLALITALWAPVALAEVNSGADPAELPRTEILGHMERIPIKHSSGHITVDIEINGQGPFKFLLDTGASGEGRIDIHE